MKSIGADNAIGIRSLIARKNEKQKRLPRFFFSKRGHMNLRRDASQHRRFAYLYEDMLT
ncbi:hypothetical protein [Parasphingopyxis sp.]|uniref:hypothetical protein n=1 Tax=Parasphingopyxis sp. TaxID=1920299 RepID=UPI0026061555|nr:hypothetical protein [Parasphingopyxis sp.]